MAEQQLVRKRTTSADFVKDPEMYKLMMAKEEALDEYLEKKEVLGEENVETQMKLVLFVVRSQLCEVKTILSGFKEIIKDVVAISRELESLGDMDMGEINERFTRGLDKYPSFMRNFIVRRRAKKYYNAVIERIRHSLIATGVGMKSVGAMMGPIMDSMKGMIGSFANAFVTKKSKKGSKNILTPALAAEIESAEQERRGGSGRASAPAAPTASASAPASSTGSESTDWNSFNS